MSGNIRPQSSQLAELLWTDPGIKTRTSVRELISISKRKEKAQANILPKSSQARKKPPKADCISKCFRICSSLCMDKRLTLWGLTSATLCHIMGHCVLDVKLWKSLLNSGVWMIWRTGEFAEIYEQVLSSFLFFLFFFIFCKANHCDIYSCNIHPAFTIYSFTYSLTLLCNFFFFYS